MVIGNDPGSFWWVGVGIFELCGSVKKKKPAENSKGGLKFGYMEAVGSGIQWD